MKNLSEGTKSSLNFSEMNDERTELTCKLDMFRQMILINNNIQEIEDFKEDENPICHHKENICKNLNTIPYKMSLKKSNLVQLNIQKFNHKILTPNKTSNVEKLLYLKTNINTNEKDLAFLQKFYSKELYSIDVFPYNRNGFIKIERNIKVGSQFQISYQFKEDRSNFANDILILHLFNEDRTITHSEKNSLKKFIKIQIDSFNKDDQIFLGMDKVIEYYHFCNFNLSIALNTLKFKNWIYGYCFEKNLRRKNLMNTSINGLCFNDIKSE